jgi:putative flippase GtrA
MSDDFEPIAYIQARFRAIASGIRLGRFASVGLVGFGVDSVVIALLTEFLSVPPLPAKLVSAEAAIVVMFVLNERWTFERWGHTSALAELRRFLTSNLVRAGGVAVATAVLLFLHNLYGIWIPLANAIGIAVGFVVNFVFESLVTWRVHRDPG